MKGEADDQHGREADRSRARRDADRQALGEVVKADRGRDREPGTKGPAPGSIALDRKGGRLRLGQRFRAGAAGDRRLPRSERPHAPFDHSQAGPAGGKPRGEKRHERDYVAERPTPVLVSAERGVDDVGALREHVDEDEGQHPDREHRERYASAGRQQLQPPDREAEVDCEAGKRSE